MPDVYWGGARSPLRSRTLTFRCTGFLPCNSGSRLGNPDNPGYIRQRKAGVGCQAPGGGPFTPGVMVATPGANRALGFLVEVEDGFGGSDSYDGTLDAIQPLESDASNDSEFVAEWSCTDVRTFFEIYFLTEGVAGANGDPTYGGPAAGDVNPRAIGIRFYEVAMAGATASASMTVEGSMATASASCSTVLDSPMLLTWYAGSVDLLLQVVNNLGDHSASASAEMEAGWQFIGPNPAVSDAAGPMSCAVNGGEVSVSVVGSYVGGSNVFTGGVAVRGDPDRRYAVQGHAFALDKDYPGSVTLGIQGSPASQPQSVVLDPSGAVEVVQRTYLAESIWDDFSRHTLGSASESDAIKTHLTSSSLVAAGEDTNDWVAMIADGAYAGLSTTHAQESPLPDPTESGGEWTHSFSGSPGNWEGYRFLRVRLRTEEAGEVVTFSTDSDPAKTFEIKTISTELVDYFVDLCHPTSPEADDNPELLDSRYPLRNDGLPHRDPSRWGVSRVRSYTIAGGTDLQVTEVALARRGTSVMDAAVAFNDWEVVQTDESYHADGSVGAVEIIQGSRGVVVTTDGRRSIIEPCSLRQLMADGGGSPFWVYAGRSARDLEGTLNACPGFACDESPYSPGDGWKALDASEGSNFLNGGPIYYAGWSGFVNGGGVRWNGNVATNTLGQVVGDEATTLYLQPRYHEVIIPPAFGDPWGDSGGGYDIPTPIRVGKILCAGVDGLVFGPTGSEVELLNELSIEVSSATSDPFRIIRMGPTPLGKGQRDHSVRWTNGTDTFVGYFVGEWDPEQGLGADEATQERWNARRFHRAAFLVITPLSRYLHLTRGPLGMLLLAIAGPTGVRLRRFDLQSVDDEFAVHESPSVGSAQVAYSRHGFVAVVYDEEGEDGWQIWRTVSSNLGETWEEPVALGPGAIPAIAIDPMAMEYVARWSGSAWRLWRRSDPDADLEDIGDIFAGGEDGRPGLESSGASEAPLVFVIDDGGSVRRFLSTNQGDTWEEA